MINDETVIDLYGWLITITILWVSLEDAEVNFRIESIEYTDQSSESTFNITDITSDIVLTHLTELAAQKYEEAQLEQELSHMVDMQLQLGEY